MLNLSTALADRASGLGIFAQLWRPAPADLPPPAVVPDPEPLPTFAEEKVGKAKKRSQSRYASVLEILAILREARRPLTVSELAAEMGCCVGEASKRVTAAGKLLKKRRDGRCVYVSTAQLTLSAWNKAHDALKGK